MVICAENVYVPPRIQIVLPASIWRIALVSVVGWPIVPGALSVPVGETYRSPGSVLVTVSVALLLVAIPAALLATTLNAPASENCTLVKTKLDAIAPEIGEPFFFH